MLGAWGVGDRRPCAAHPQDHRLGKAGAIRLAGSPHVDAGSCNACEHELTAASGPHNDLQRYGLGVVASPRHADALLITGPITVRMVDALLRAYESMPDPRLVAALGDCAIGCPLLAGRDEIAGPLENLLPVDIRVPGCPRRPDQIADALLDALALLRPVAR